MGVFGIIAVVLAGWTTANPTIYRAGLAFQAVMPRTSIFWVTILAGTLATFAGLFPAFAMKLLDFVALYGFILAPVGAIIVYDHYSPKGYLNTTPFIGSFNKNVLIAWFLSIFIFYGISVKYEVFLSFFTLPTWIMCATIFMVLETTTYRQEERKGL